MLCLQCLHASKRHRKSGSDIFIFHFVGQSLTVKHILKGVIGHTKDVRGALRSPLSFVGGHHFFLIYWKALVRVYAHTQEAQIGVKEVQKRFQKTG